MQAAPAVVGRLGCQARPVGSSRPTARPFLARPTQRSSRLVAQAFGKGGGDKEVSEYTGEPRREEALLVPPLPPSLSAASRGQLPNLLPLSRSSMLL